VFFSFLLSNMNIPAWGAGIALVFDHAKYKPTSMIRVQMSVSENQTERPE
jgi:hypothetical protein